MLSTLTLFDASLVILRLGGLLDARHPGWMLLAALFFVSGPGSWALAAQGVPLRPLIRGLAMLGGLGIAYSAVLTQALRGGGVDGALQALAAATLLLMGVMELLLVDDAKRVLGGFTSRCLSGIPLYIWPLVVLFNLLAVRAARQGSVAAALAATAAIAYSAASRPPRGSRPLCTLASAAVVSGSLAALVDGDPLEAAAAALLSVLLAIAPHAPVALREREPGVVDRLVLLGVAAVAASASHARLDPWGLAGEAAVYAAVALAGWAATITVALLASRSRLATRVAESPVLRHAAGFALLLAGLHVMHTNMDPGLAIIAAAAGVAVINTATRARSERGEQEPTPISPWDHDPWEAPPANPS